jgi:hypothetical protein
MSSSIIVARQKEPQEIDQCSDEFLVLASGYLAASLLDVVDPEGVSKIPHISKQGFCQGQL